MSYFTKTGHNRNTACCNRLVIFGMAGHRAFSFSAHASWSTSVFGYNPCCIVMNWLAKGCMQNFTKRRSPTQFRGNLRLMHICIHQRSKHSRVNSREIIFNFVK